MTRWALISLSVGSCLVAIASPFCPADEATQRRSGVPSDEPAEMLFVRRIQPLLADKCLPCHGGAAGNDDSLKSDGIKGQLDLRSLDGVMKGGESGRPAIFVGNSSQSGLLLAATRDSSDWSAMPPKDADRLSEKQLEWLREWIDSGAIWPDPTRAEELAAKFANEWSQSDGVTMETSGGLSQDWNNRRYDPNSLWAYQPVRKPELQAADGRLITGTEAIDAMIDARLPPGLTAAPEATPRELIRRATFDLTGLPPSPEHIAAFETDFAANPDVAMAAMIDRLLASPHYGERMAQHWLDVTRYADSSGFSNDYERGSAWRYRDYVIRAFNDDKPYNRFVKEQIAGDELVESSKAGDESKYGTAELFIAAGFLRMGPWELTGMEVAKLARQRFLDDVTNSIGETFLAHSLQCARCHDHKFDPVPTRDYYSIQAIFATTQLADRTAPFLTTENTSGFDEKTYSELQKQDHLKALEELDEILLINADRWFAEHKKDPAAWTKAVERARTNGNSRQRRPFSDVFSAARNMLAREGVAESEYPPKLVGFTPEQFGAERVARKGLERLMWQLDRYEPIAMSVYSGPTPNLKSVNAPLRLPAQTPEDSELEQTQILRGGDPFGSGEIVAPGVLSAVRGLAPPSIPATTAGRRLAFAEWLTHPNNGLTTRTIVNRIWLWHFNEALAGNPNNFGTTGKRPTHPELLNWLAATLVENDWSIKSLHRTIMLSRAWRRSVHHPDPAQLEQLDPHRISYAVFRSRRLSAEELRDAMLSVSGELNRAIGGIPVRPEINPEAALQPRQVMGTFAAAWVPNPRPEQRHRRSIYTLKLRGLTDPAMEVFNAPSADFSCERRDFSTVTPQVFAMFNSQTSLSRSLVMARRVLEESTLDKQAIDRCFELIYGRHPEAHEMELCLQHWRMMEEIESTSVHSKSGPPTSIRREAVEENTGERFSFVEHLHAAGDYVPDLHPAECDIRTRALANVCLVLFNSNEFFCLD